MEEQHDKRKPHRPKTSGRKAEKKAKRNEKTKEVSQAGMTAKQRNPKAFAVQNVGKLQKKVRRTLDIKEKKVHHPVVDRTPLQPPPIIVAVVGPPKVGKSTLMRGLIKNFTSQKLTNVKGPVTIVSGKQRRITFIECGNDLNSMIDVAKVADLALLLIDASFGMEMETFEFLNICQVHGFPRIMGVLTHLDYFKNNKKLRTTRKTLKHRFWTELYQGAKLFYLSGMMYGEYLKKEIHNLARFISVMKFRPLAWRNSHPYILADRLEDITDPEVLRLNPNSSRKVSFYGYMRGLPLKNQSTVHIPGCGDFTLYDVSHLPDPCPLPDQSKRRSLNDIERKVYAPFSGVGGIVYDKDAVYIDTGNAPNQNESDDEQDDMSALTSAIISTQKPLDEKLTESKLSIFSDSKAITSEQFSNLKMPSNYEVIEQGGRTRRKAVFNTPDPVFEKSDDENESEEEDDIENVPEHNSRAEDAAGDDHISFDEDESGSEEEYNQGKSGYKSAKGNYIEGNPQDSDSVEEEEEEEAEERGQLRWKDNLAARAAQAFLEQQKTTPNLRKLVYDVAVSSQRKEKSETDQEEELGGLFKLASLSDSAIDDSDYSRIPVASTRDWSSEEMKYFIKDCFVTGEWEDSKDAKKLLDEDDAMYGDFEDLEKGSDMSDEVDNNIENEGDDDDEISDTEKNAEGEPADGNSQRSKKISKEERQKKIEEKRLEKKRRVKEMFDEEYDRQTHGDGAENFFDQKKAELDAQAKLNRSEFDGMDDDLRVLYEGYRAGLYVRVEIQDMPAEFITNFDPTYPIVIGGMTTSETVIGTLQARFKKHRWYNKILKTRDPLIFSLGWRRFQSIPIYTIQDHNGRNRHLKYTPEHMHCNAIFWGPSTPQNTGLLCIQDLSAENKGFRVAATGVILAIDKSIPVMKKLKLIGYPLKVHKKTAFIKDMFSSQLEVAKFEGAKIRTVSGIRGQVKKSIKSPNGAFRATFEDTILMSDIVFLKTWYHVELPKFYNPVTNLLAPKQDGSQWVSMKTLGMLRKEKGIKAPFTEDSQYQKEAIRKEHNLKPFVVPRSLQKDLPFQYKPKVRGKWEDPVLSKRVAIVRDSHEKKRDQLLSQLRAIQAVQKINSRESMLKRRKKHVTLKKKQEELAGEKKKKVRKELYKQLGKIKEKVHKKMNHGEAVE